jgi:hypothetical protein
MAKPEHVAKLKQGVDAWNQWRQENRGKARGPRTVVSLGRFAWSGTNVPDLTQANLVGEYLAGIDFSGANLMGAHFAGTQLREADLSRANLVGASFYNTDLSGTNFAEAVVGSTMFTRTDLSDVAGLESVRHNGPSIIDIDSVYRSHGNIPEPFLRGAGVPEEFVIYVRSLVGKPIDFYSCFISYSTKDQEFADRLHADLQDAGVRCWFAPHDVQGGKKVHEQIDQAIRLHEKLLLILSPDSMNSEWVKTEIAKARKRELQEKRQVLFPIRLAAFEVLRDWECFDADTRKDSAREIREYFIPDFSNWKSRGSYQMAFKRLLRDLKAEKTDAETP